MKISKQKLIEMKACESGLECFIEQTNGIDEPVEIISLIGGKNTYSDALWLAGKTLPKQKIIKFACDAALINIELIKPYTDEYELIVDLLNNPTADAATRAARAAAAAAASADVVAADVAHSVADIAYITALAAAAAVSADVAADAATRAALAAAAAASADVTAVSALAASAASRAAADGKKEQVDQLLINMFNEVE